MNAQIVEPTEAQREQIARLLSTAVNFPLDRALANAPHLRLEDPCSRVRIPGVRSSSDA